MNDELNSIYTDTSNPASYSASVAAFLQSKRSLSVHKRKLRNFKRRKWIVPGPYQTICADLIDYQQYSRMNGGFKYILVVIDAFSRMAYTKALINKTALEVAMALDEILNDFKYPPSIFVSDKGGEFDIRNNVFISVIRKYNLSVYYAKGVTKNAIVERWNRTLKTRLERFFTETSRKRWIDVLQEFTRNINHSKNRSLGMSPSEVTLKNAPNIYKRLHPEVKRPKDCKLKIGDVVRIAIEGNVFKKGYRQNWSDSLYTVESIKKSQGFCLYHIKDSEDNIINRYFYLDELSSW